MSTKAQIVYQSSVHESERAEGHMKIKEKERKKRKGETCKSGEVLKHSHQLIHQSKETTKKKKQF